MAADYTRLTAKKPRARSRRGGTFLSRVLSGPLPPILGEIRGAWRLTAVTAGVSSTVMARNTRFTNNLGLSAPYHHVAAPTIWPTDHPGRPQVAIP